MAKSNRHRFNALDVLGTEKLARAKDLLPAIERAQEIMRLHELGSIAPLLKAARQQEDLLRRASLSLNIGSSALEAAKNLTMPGDAAAAAMKDTLRIQSASLDLAKGVATEMGASAGAIQTALQIDTSALDHAAKNLTLAGEAAAIAMKHSLHLDASALDLAKTLAPQLDAAASIRSMLAGSGVLDQIRAIPELTTSWRNAIVDLGRITSILPPDAFANIGSVAESLRLTMPTVPVIDPALFGGAWNDSLAEAVARLRARAEQVANDPEASAEDVEALAAEAGAVAASAPAEARPGINEYASRIFLWLGREVRNDVAKLAVYKAAFTVYVILMVLAYPPTPPAAPPPPAALITPGPLPKGSGALIGAGDLADGLPGIIRRAGPEAEARTLEFLGNVRNRNTRDAYVQGLVRFTNWCEGRNLELTDITAFTVNAYINEMERDYKAATVRQHLAAIRLLFDHLVAGGVVKVNPASDVRGPKEAIRKRKTAALQPHEIRQLLDSVNVSELSGLRDRALISVMVYAFARVSPLIAMDVRDYTAHGGGRWLRLYEKGGTPHEVPAHPKAQEYLDAYVDAAGFGGAPDSPLWRTMAKDRRVTEQRMSRMDVYRALKRRAEDANLGAAATCQNLRAAGLTAYLANGGTVKRAQAIAAHASPRTTKLYELAVGDEITAADIEKIGI